MGETRQCMVKLKRISPKAHKERDSKEREKSMRKSNYKAFLPYLGYAKTKFDKANPRPHHPIGFCSLVCVHKCKRRKGKPTTPF